MYQLTDEEYDEYFKSLLISWGEKASVYELSGRKKYLEAILKNLSEPFVQDFGGLREAGFLSSSEGENVYGFTSYLSSLAKKLNSSENEYYLDVLCTEDEEWTKFRNEGLTGIFYKKYTLKSQVQEILKNIINELIAKIEVAIDEQKKAKELVQQQIDSRKSLCEIKQVHKDIQPTGGEDGVDGWFECDVLVVETQEIVRAVLRDVFDFGVYSFPSRETGSDSVLDRTNWTKDEITACNWLNEFGPFSSIRM